ncbi:MAG: Orotidine 5'-phosphate decarboxylase [Chlamydiae bacterium]|nr:Orotidine 5'-phosphate decarboxylase [Chlamydiota bacterium]
MPSLSFSERAEHVKHPKLKKLFHLIENKKSNLALSADIPQKKDLLELADTMGPEICILKTHIDTLNDFDSSFIKDLKALSEKHDFLLFEDRKFADIGNTVHLQYHEGIYKISSWADIINAHPIVGPGVIKGLEAKSEGTLLLLLAQMSSKNNLMDASYQNSVLKLADTYSDSVSGFISMKKISENPNFIHMTPGIQLEEGHDKFGQQYRTPEQAITNDQTDIIIVGRGIYGSSDPLKQAKRYKQAAWEAYLKRLNA